MGNKLTVTADLINDKVKFSGVSRDNNEIFIDAVQPLGEGDGYTPLELFLMSLATCSGMTLALLQYLCGKPTPSGVGWIA